MRRGRLEELDASQMITNKNNMPVGQGRLRQTMNPTEQQPMDVVFNAPKESYLDKLNAQDYDKQKLEQNNRLGQERQIANEEKQQLGRDRLAFDKQKSDQIYDVKNQEVEARAQNAENNLKLANDRLQMN